MIVLATTVLGLFAYYAAGYPAVGVAVPIAAALCSAAELGRAGWALGAASIALATSVFFRLAEGQELSLVVGYELAGHALLMAGAIAVGDGIRSRRALIAHAREIVALTSERAQRESEATAHAQRITVARDLHDSIGHSTSIISLHADVAREAVGRGDDAAAAEALHVIKDTTGSTMIELRRTVAVLRAPDQTSRTAAGLSNVRSLIDLGSEVKLTTDIQVPDALPSIIDATAFRIIQESVTNIVRHSTATRAHIEAICRGDELHVAVVDNGRSKEARSSATSGHGVAGMRERAAALGGTLEVGSAEGGFAVRARIPLKGGS
ncbi:sensor histidine kinase [Aeromicrobium sp. CF4.19]|uniref:sensor histidine kinase n=1 Tax=Aeromicrobium sp. CF4.19 TaxID=3373082 RepID=UPI003EE55D37